jgi:aspartate carbamoyltransferase catalytic subunit
MRCVPRHLVSIADLDASEIVRILDHGDRYWALANEPIKKLTSLRGRTVINLFFENSTRTRTSFEIAAKRLSAEAINISSSGSSRPRAACSIPAATSAWRRIRSSCATRSAARDVAAQTAVRDHQRR